MRELHTYGGMAPNLARIVAREFWIGSMEWASRLEPERIYGSATHRVYAASTRVDLRQRARKH